MGENRSEKVPFEHSVVPVTRITKAEAAQALADVQRMDAEAIETLDGDIEDASIGRKPLYSLHFAPFFRAC